MGSGTKRLMPSSRREQVMKERNAFACVERHQAFALAPVSSERPCLAHVRHVLVHPPAVPRAAHGALRVHPAHRQLGPSRTCFKCDDKIVCKLKTRAFETCGLSNCCQALPPVWRRRRSGRRPPSRSTPQCPTPRPGPASGTLTRTSSPPCREAGPSISFRGGHISCTFVSFC
jgi:hypothetical protein